MENKNKNYFELGTRVQVIKDFWFYDEFYKVGTVFIIEEQHVLHDFGEYVVASYI